MGPIFPWLERLFDFLFSLLPHIHTVNANEMGVKFSRGKNLTVLRPGLSLYWPIVTEEPDNYHLGERSVDLASCKLTTEDGFRIALSVSALYRVYDVALAVTASEDFEEILVDRAGGALANVVMSSTWDELFEGVETGDFQDDLHKKLVETTKGMGLAIVGVRVMDFAETKVISLVGDGNMTGGNG